MRYALLLFGNACGEIYFILAITKFLTFSFISAYCTSLSVNVAALGYCLHLIAEKPALRGSPNYDDCHIRTKRVHLLCTSEKVIFMYLEK